MWTSRPVTPFGIIAINWRGKYRRRFTITHLKEPHLGPNLIPFALDFTAIERFSTEQENITKSWWEVKGKLPKAQENASAQVAIGFSFESDGWEKLHNFSKSITAEVKQQQSNPRLPSTLNWELRYTPSEKQLAPPFQPIKNIINVIGDLVNPVFPPLVQIICALSLALFADVFRSDKQLDLWPQVETTLTLKERN